MSVPLFPTPWRLARRIVEGEPGAVWLTIHAANGRCVIHQNVDLRKPDQAARAEAIEQIVLAVNAAEEALYALRRAEEVVAGFIDPDHRDGADDTLDVIHGAISIAGGAQAASGGVA